MSCDDFRLCLIAITYESKGGGVQFSKCPRDGKKDPYSSLISPIRGKKEAFRRHQRGVRFSNSQKLLANGGDLKKLAFLGHG